MKQILILLISVLQASLAFATGLSCDIIYINGEKWWLMDKPLYRDSIVYAKLNEFLPEERIVSTANWEGYTAYWTVTDGKVYLQKIDAYMYKPQTGEENTLTYEVDSLKNLFSSYYDGKRICAKWLNGEIRSGRGKNLRYVHAGFDRNMEEEYVMSVKDGVVVNHQHYHNYKKKGYKLMFARRELEKRFPFKQFPELEGKMIAFFLHDFKISPDGHFLGCDVEAKLPDGLVKDQQHPIIKAFLAAMKDIYPWEVLYINGEYRMEYRTFAIPLRYPTLKWKQIEN